MKNENTACINNNIETLSNNSINSPIDNKKKRYIFKKKKMEIPEIKEAKIEEAPPRTICDNITFEGWVALKYYKESKGEKKKKIVSSKLYYDSKKWTIEKFQDTLNNLQIDYDDIKAEINLKNSNKAFLDFDKWGITYEEIINKYPFLKDVDYSPGNTRGFRFIVENNDFIGGANYTKVNEDKNMDILCEKIWLYPPDVPRLFTDIYFYHRLSDDNLKLFLTNEDQHYKFANERGIIKPLPYTNIDIPEFTEDEKKSKNYRMVDALPLKLVDTGSYQNWVKIVYSLASVSEYKIAKYVSMKSKDAYDENVFNKLYSGFNPNIKGRNGGPITILTLYDLVKQHCPDEFKKINKDFKENVIIEDIEDEDDNEDDPYFISVKTLENKDRDIALHILKIIKPIAKYTQKRFIVYDKNTGLWKEFFTLFTLIVDTCQQCIRHSKQKIQNKNIPYAKLIEMDEIYNKYYKYVSQQGFKTNVEKDFKADLAEQDFYSKLNSKIDIIAFKNCIYDIIKKTTRPITKEDYLTKTLDYDYNPNINEEKKKKLVEELKKIINYDDNHKEYVLSALGQALSGRSMKHLYYIVGLTGDNGKSTLLELCEEKFDIYVKGMDHTDIETGKGKGDRHKTLAELKGKRIVWVEECDKKKLDVRYLKQLSGGKKIDYKVMFGTCDDLKINFKLFMISNQTPDLSGDCGSENRNRLIAFSSRFPKKQEEDDFTNKIFKQDIRFQDKILNEYGDEFVQLILDYSSKYYDELAPIPIEFQNKTNTLNEMSKDKVDTWFIDYISNSNNKDDKLTAKEINDTLISKGIIKFPLKLKDLNDKMEVIFNVNYDKCMKKNNVRGGFRFVKFENIIEEKKEPSKSDKEEFIDDDDDELSQNNTEEIDDDTEIDDLDIIKSKGVNKCDICGVKSFTKTCVKCMIKNKNKV